MKLSAVPSLLVFIGSLLLVVKVSSSDAQHPGAAADEDEEGSLSSTSPTLRAPRKRTERNIVVAGEDDDGTATATMTKTGTPVKEYSSNKGIILSKGGFGKINTSSIASAQAAGISVLQALPESSGSETFVPKNANAKHMRYGQQIHGMDVEGASLYVHVDKFGTVVGVNGELVNGTSVPSTPTIDARSAIAAALKESRVPAEVHGNCSPPTLTVVRGLADGEAHLAWTCTVRYDMVGEDGYLKPFKDQIFARATGDAPGGLIQIHPKIYGARSLETRNCNQSTRTCPIVNTNPDKIAVLPIDLPIESAHNYAIDTYDYYWEKHGRDSIDNNGMKLISLVHYGRNYNNAFWDGSKMTYGDGDGVILGPLSLGLDVVAHELTHGVTEHTSRLIYADEPGALNEAMSDIFSALVESYVGTIGDDVWLLGEDVWTPGTAGDALRYLCDPAKDNTSRDYYPDRYQGGEDYGGVHWNSGIANLAACLLANGGTHPRGKAPGVTVNAIGYDALGSIFYQANMNCLTPFSNFAAARWCTADVFGGSNKDNVHLAWDAVGVPNDPPPPPPAPTPFTVDSSGVGTFTSQAATTGDLHQYTMPVREGLTISCSIVGSNGDADLYVRFGSEAIPNPSSSANACVSAGTTSVESCTTGSAPSGGTIAYAGVHAYSSYTGLKVTCKENLPPSTDQPALMPTLMPTLKPSMMPTMMPTLTPSMTPTMKPTMKPTMMPTMKPTMKPSTKLTMKPSTKPTMKPSTKPTMKPSTKPTMKPSIKPTLKPTRKK